MMGNKAYINTHKGIGCEKMSNSIYKSNQGKKIVQDLYDQQLNSIEIEYEDLYVDTRFGKTHVIKAGNVNGKPLLFFHGGNSTAPFSLKQSVYLTREYQVFAPDIIGHPGKSDQTSLSPYTLEYGKWALDVIDSLGFEQIMCVGGSFGAGVLMKLMCVSPEKILKSVLVVPSGISNSSKVKIVSSMGIPMIAYIITKKEKWLKKAITPMIGSNKYIDTDIIDMVRIIFEHVKVKATMPSDIKASDIKNYKAPTLLFAGEKDILFSGKKVIGRARNIINNIEAHLLENCAHMYFCCEESNNFISIRTMEFLAE